MALFINKIQSGKFMHFLAGSCNTRSAVKQQSREIEIQQPLSFFTSPSR
nr:hypothetical protein [uncultured Mucilaginibacter sp.]